MKKSRALIAVALFPPLPRGQKGSRGSHTYACIHSTSSEAWRDRRWNIPPPPSVPFPAPSRSSEPLPEFLAGRVRASANTNAPPAARRYYRPLRTPPLGAMHPLTRHARSDRWEPASGNVSCRKSRPSSLSARDSARALKGSNLGKVHRKRRDELAMGSSRDARR